MQRDPKEDLLKAFRLFDDDQTGRISLRNLRRVARELGEEMSDDELRAMIDEFDVDNDGESECVAGRPMWKGGVARVRPVWKGGVARVCPMWKGEWLGFTPSGRGSG